MANGGDPHPSQNLRSAAATEYIEEQNPAVPSSPRREIPIANLPRIFRAPRRRVNLTQESRSLINSFRSADVNAQEKEPCLQSLFNLMTSEEEEGAAQFRGLISEIDENDLRSMASLLTSNSDDYFLDIARNWNGSIRLQTLLGKSNVADTLFLDAILRLFLDVMTDKNASYVATQGMRVFSEQMKSRMRPHIISNVIRLACDRHGCNALNAMITLARSLYREHLLFIVASNALMLSDDAFGHLVVQRVLRLNDFRCTHNVATILRRHCVELSSTKYGRYVVEKLLETAESRAMVVKELSWCNEDRLKTLAMNEYGNFVVETALRRTQDEIMNERFLFGGLLYKLRPLITLLHGSPGRRIAELLESIDY